MNIEDLRNKMVAVLGFGQEGKATTNYLIKHGVKPVLFDQKPWEEWDDTEKQNIKDLKINFVFGPDYLKELNGYDVIFRSPGISISKLDSIKSTITSQTKWFFEHSKAKIIGVTGTKGKGTTSALIYSILKQRFQFSIFNFQKKPKIHLTGNIGEVQPFEILDNLSKDDFVVFELSSFQLQDLDKSPHISVVLMTTQEHLDYHKSVEEYRDAKASVVKFQNENDFAVINGDFPASIEIGKLGKGNKIYFSRQKELQNGCFLKNDNIVFNALNKNFQFSTTNIQLRGQHNLENICAAISACICAGCEQDPIRKGILEFKGLKHRLEFVSEKNGIKFYNDSFSTTPETTMAAINSFTGPLIIILGGSSKKSDFTELGSSINGSKNIKAVILIGEEAKKIKEKITSKEKILEGAKDMKSIFDQIRSVAGKGDVVLLSPACASFGMFKNYKDRGEQFKKYSLEFK